MVLRHAMKGKHAGGGAGLLDFLNNQVRGRLQCRVSSKALDAPAGLLRGRGRLCFKLLPKIPAPFEKLSVLSIIGPTFGAEEQMP
jgi:hypothetical protein